MFSDNVWQAPSDEVMALRREVSDMKEIVAMPNAWFAGNRPYRRTFALIHSNGFNRFRFESETIGMYMRLRWYRNGPSPTNDTSSADTSGRRLE